MNSDAIARIHEELGFAEFEARLKAVAGVWSTIKKLQAKAGQSQQDAKAYRQFLVRCIKNLTADTPLTPEAVIAACDDFKAHVERLMVEHQIERLEYLRGGLGWEEWMAKFYPADYERYTQALFSACEEGQTEQTFARLNAALDTVIQVYVNAFDGA